LIALDSSAFARFFDDPSAAENAKVAKAIHSGDVVLPPPVVTELLSNPRLPDAFAAFVLATPVLPLHDDYWARTGRLRADVLRRSLRAGLADCLIAQSCIDNDVPLITYDRDFRHVEVAGLKLA
jgi:predicted nucleic acid-binding protein